MDRRIIIKEGKLPANWCPLCELENIRSVVYLTYDRARTYYCLNCGTYTITYLAYRYTPLSVDQETRTKLSYYIYHNSSDDEPVFIKNDDVKDIVRSVSLPDFKTQFDNLLEWFFSESENSLDTVDGNIKQLIARFGCKSPQQLINLLDALVKEGLIEMENPTGLPLRDRSPFYSFAAHLTTKGILLLSKRTNITDNANPTSFIKHDVEEIFSKDEDFETEIKGSFLLDINRLLKGDGVKYLNNRVAIDGVLRSSVAFLNSNGGTIVVGVLEKNKFTKEELTKISGKDINNYYVIGIEIENSDLDNYQLRIRENIANYISPDLAGLIDISFQEYSGLKICLIGVSPGKIKWYYLDGKRFIVRDGNRSVELSDEAMDSYKNRHNRG